MAEISGRRSSWLKAGRASFGSRHDIPPTLAAFHAASPMGKTVERLFALAQFGSWATWRWGTRAYAHHLPSAEQEAFEKERSRGVDLYIRNWSFALLLGFALAAGRPCVLSQPYATVIAVLSGTFVAAGILRVFDIVQANANMHVFDGVRVKTSHHVASLLRSTLISVWNYLELVGWFSLFYLSVGGLEGDNKDHVLNAFDTLYFSTITQLTIGFGDLKPAGAAARILTMTQGLLGTMFLIFAIGRFASLLPKVEEPERNTPEVPADEPPA